MTFDRLMPKVGPDIRSSEGKAAVGGPEGEGSEEGGGWGGEDGENREGERGRGEEKAREETDDGREAVPAATFEASPKPALRRLVPRSIGFLIRGFLKARFGV